MTGPCAASRMRRRSPNAAPAPAGPRPGFDPWSLVAGAVVLLCLLTAPVPAVTHLEPGAPAPAFELPDLEGAKHALREFEGRPVVLVFGELYHGKTLEACRQITAVLKTEPLRDQTVMWVLIAAQDADPSALRARAPEAEPVPSLILHDRGRTVYDAYRVAVLPSVVVADSEGRVVHTIAAFTERFSDILADALLLALGKIDRETFQRRLHPKAAGDADAAAVRAPRTTDLAHQLVRRGLVELASEKYAEALKHVPDYAPAHLGLGMLLLKERHLAEAEQQFRAVLEVDPSLSDASLGLAFVQTLRGKDELEPAEQRVRQILARNPNEARAHYLLGLIHKQRNQMEEAAASFQEAAELLLRHTQPERFP